MSVKTAMKSSDNRGVSANFAIPIYFSTGLFFMACDDRNGEDFTCPFLADVAKTCALQGAQPCPRCG